MSTPFVSDILQSYSLLLVLIRDTVYTKGLHFLGQRDSVQTGLLIFERALADFLIDIISVFIFPQTNILQKHTPKYTQTFRTIQ